MPKPPNPVDKHVGSRVRMRRLMLTLSQTELADALGISFQQVQKYEKGSNRVSASRLQQIANFLQVPVAFFFDECSGSTKTGTQSGRHASSDFVSEFIASSDGLSLIKSYTKIKNRNLRRSIVEFIEQLAG